MDIRFSIMTGRMIKRILEYMGNETFMHKYGHDAPINAILMVLKPKM